MDLELISDELIRRFENNLSADDMPILKAWMDLSPANRAFVEEDMSRKNLAEDLMLLIDQDTAGAKKKFQQAMDAVQIPVITRTRSIRPYLKAAAIIMVLAGTATWWYTHYRKAAGMVTSDQQRQITRTISTRTMAILPGQDTLLLETDNLDLALLKKTRHFPAGAIEVYTPAGKALNLILPDQSQATLNAESWLSYNAEEGPHGIIRRTVILQGEAFFDITPNSNAPFTVGSRQATVNVMGTRFNLIDYGPTRPLQLTLLTGAVKISNGAAEKTLHPGEEASIQAGSADIHWRHLTDTSDILSWRTNKFILTDQNIPQIMDQVLHWYGLTRVVYQGPVDTTTKEISGRGTIGRGANVDSVLSDILRGPNLQHKLSNGVLTVYK